ncbi:hypothetical protein WJX74_004717 [Apatococcus lobatus]|uniref:HNH endonuclease n=1 Tax=Apatococcus lobatus TaxID=904363 RepID=A0AAW1R0P1_9CHLO
MKQRRAGIKRKQADQPEDKTTCRTCSEEKMLDQMSSGSSSRCKACVADYMKRRLALDVHTRIRSGLRCRHWYALKRAKTSLVDRRTEEEIGCSIQELREHLERLFKPGMTWSNWGRLPDQWEIDHIRPCRSFDDLGDPDQRRQCFHYTNLQPLWMPENRSKSYLWDADNSM